MSYQVARKRVVTNDVLMGSVSSLTIPDTGWQYHSNGSQVFKYVFATWKSQVDTSFPPLITDTGSINAAYWYLPIGGNGPSPHLVRCYAMFLGDDTTDALFNQDNPIDSVNGAAWTGGRDVSTASGAVSIIAENSLSSESFDRWIKLWGNVSITGSTLSAPDQADGAAVAVYAPDMGRIYPEFDLGEVFEFVEKVVHVDDFIADYLDEHRHLIKALTAGDPRLDIQIEKAIGELGPLDPAAIQRKLLEMRADMQRMEAMEKMLGTFGKGG